MTRTCLLGLTLVGLLGGVARADALADMRRALWARGGTATPEGRAWGLAVGRQAGDPAPGVWAAAPLPGYAGVAGTRVRASRLEGVRLAFADPAQAATFGRSYWSAVEQAGNGRFHPQYMEVRGDELILLEGPALGEGGQVAELLRQARGGATSPPDLIGMSPQGRPRPLQGRGATGAVDPQPQPQPNNQPQPQPQPQPNNQPNNQPANSQGNNQPANSQGNNQPANSQGNNQPANSQGNNQPANSQGNDQPANSQPAAEQPAGETASDGAANATGWQRWYRGIVLDGVPIPRAGLANRTLQRALRVSTEPYGQVTQYQGKSLVKGKTSWFGGPRDTGVTATETGAISGERLRSLNQPATEAAVRQHPERFYYAAMRYDYGPKGKSFWARAKLLVINPRNGFAIVVRNVDWGPHTRTKRIIDLSPQAMGVLQLKTDQEALVAFADPGAPLGPVR